MKRHYARVHTVNGDIHQVSIHYASCLVPTIMLDIKYEVHMDLCLVAIRWRIFAMDAATYKALIFP